MQKANINVYIRENDFLDYVNRVSWNYDYVECKISEDENYKICISVNIRELRKIFDALQVYLPNK